MSLFYCVFYRKLLLILSTSMFFKSTTLAYFLFHLVKIVYFNAPKSQFARNSFQIDTVKVQ